jgi:hypothetical protein
MVMLIMIVIVILIVIVIVIAIVIAIVSIPNKTVYEGGGAANEKYQKYY